METAFQFLIEMVQWENEYLVGKVKEVKKGGEDMDKICGACSKQENMTKEERIQLAMSRLPNTIYTCPLCNEKHSYSAQEQAPIPPVEPPKEAVAEPVKKTKSKKPPEPEQEQLALF